MNSRTVSLSEGLKLTAFIALVSLGGSAYADPAPPHGIVAATIGVRQLGFDNPPENVVVTNQYAIGDFRIRPTANKGDYDIQIGEVLSDDVDGGVLITSIAENGGRDNVDQNGVSDPTYPGINTATSHIDYGRTGATAGGYFIPLAMTYPNSAGTTVVEYNLNVSAAWFPYNKWLGAFIRNSGATNGGANNLMSSSPELVLGTHFTDLGSGRSTVDLTSLGINSQRDGVLLVVGAKNEDNYALSQANANGTWTIFSKDNGTDAASLEQDPVAFVYIPKTNQTVISGRFGGDGTIIIAGGNFTVTPLDEGRWELKIPGKNPDNGVLVISPEGGQTQNRDNIVSFAPNAARDGWIIESRDLPNGVPPGETMPFLETPGVEPVASFVFVPGPTAGILLSATNNVFTTESGGTGTVTVALETKPRNSVTIGLSSSNPAEGAVAPASLTFTPENWNVPQTITVTGKDDSVTDGPVSYQIVFGAAASADADYNGRVAARVNVVNLDDDGAITVNPTGGLVTSEKGGTATFSVHLDRAPSADVTIALSSSNVAEGLVSPDKLVFTPANWNQDQTVTVTGVDDSVDDGDVSFTIITAPAVSSDSFFNGKNGADVAVRNTDDDTAAVLVSPTTGLQVLENGGTASYTVVLATKPMADVVIKPVTGSTGEVSIAPGTISFNAANWNVPARVTLTGVDDLAADGNKSYTITNLLASTDTLYAVLKPANVSATTLDNEATLTVFPEPVIYGLGQPAKGIASRSSVIDTNNSSYAGATLTAQLTGDTFPEDVLEIRDGGPGAGVIHVSGNDLLFDDFGIGSFSGGAGSAPLKITFKNAASAESVEAVLHGITFRTTNTKAAPGLRNATITLAHADGGSSSFTVQIRVGLLRASNFQEGADFGYGKYSGAADIELNESRPDTAYPKGRGATGLLVDWRDDNTANAGNVLLRFDNIVGNGPGQIPTNSIIVSAELFLDINDTGDGSPLYRMLQPWDAESSTWNSIGGGVAPDGIRARLDHDSQIGLEDGSGATTAGTVWVSVTPDVQAWVSGGETNYGWAMPAWPLRLDGTAVSPSEADNIDDRPRLRVFWLPKDSVSKAAFRQGVNDYVGAVDTRIRQNAPDTDFSGSSTVFVDAVVSGTDPNPEQVLLRFDGIVGSGPGQIPAGARVQAAMLDLASLNGDAMGDGGLFYTLLQSWPDPGTWNGWVDGVQTNGVEAAATPSTVAGNADLNPDVQGGFLSFDMTRDVQAWVNNTVTNNGWVIMPWPGGGNGWGFYTSETGVEAYRPQLRVYYTLAPAQTTIRLSVRLQGNAVQLSFNAETGKSYSVYRAAKVEGPWTKAQTITATSSTASYTDGGPVASATFYRVSSP